MSMYPVHWWPKSPLPNAEKHGPGGTYGLQPYWRLWTHPVIPHLRGLDGSARLTRNHHWIFVMICIFCCSSWPAIWAQGPLSAQNSQNYPKIPKLAHWVQNMRPSQNFAQELKTIFIHVKLSLLPTWEVVLSKNLPTSAAHRMKIISMGDSGTGKSCLIKRFCEERFVPRYVPMLHF